MARFFAILLVGLALLAGACGPAPVATSAPARTAVPMWTLPFSLTSSTPAPATEPPVSASATPASAATEAPVLGPAPTALPTEAPAALSPTQAVPASPPRLMIPGLKLDRDIEQVGILNGTWDLTNLGDEVGWLSTTGRHPGDNLAVVLVGHVTTAPGQYGPFAGIGQLAVDDEIIYRWDGRDYVYAVRSHARADETDVQRLYVPDGRQLLLVTCSSYNFFSSSYERRLIITAEWIGTVAAQ